MLRLTACRIRLAPARLLQRARRKDDRQEEKSENHFHEGISGLRIMNAINTNMKNYTETPTVRIPLRLSDHRSDCVDS